MRVHELAKKLGVSSKEVIAEIKKLGGTVKNHMSQVDDSMLTKLTASVSKQAPKAQVAKPKKTVKKEPVKTKSAVKIEKSAEKKK